MTLVTKIGEFKGSGRLFARPISPSNIRQAHLLAQLSWNDLSYIDWIAMIARSAGATVSAGHWIALQDARDCVYAIGYFETFHTVDRGLTMRVSNCVIADGPALQVTATMSDCLSFAARSAGVQALQIELLDSGSRDQAELIRNHFDTHGWRTHMRFVVDAKPEWN